MALFKIKLEDDTLFDYEVEGTLEIAMAQIVESVQFVHCKDYRGKTYYVNKNMIKLVYSDSE